MRTGQGCSAGNQAALIAVGRPWPCFLTSNAKNPNAENRVHGKVSPQFRAVDCRPPGSTTTGVERALISGFGFAPVYRPR